MHNLISENTPKPETPYISNNEIRTIDSPMISLGQLVFSSASAKQNVILTL